MVRKYNAPVKVQVYLGSGEHAEELRIRLMRKAAAIKKDGSGSLSEFIVDLMRKHDPSLFKGLEEHGQK